MANNQKPRVWVCCAWCGKRFSINGAEAKFRIAKSVSGLLFHNRACSTAWARAQKDKAGFVEAATRLSSESAIT